MSKKKCEICGQRPATVPDRDRPGRPVSRICSECHRSRLAGDMKIVMAAAAKQARTLGIALGMLLDEKQKARREE